MRNKGEVGANAIHTDLIITTITLTAIHNVYLYIIQSYYSCQHPPLTTKEKKNMKKTPRNEDEATANNKHNAINTPP